MSPAAALFLCTAAVIATVLVTSTRNRKKIMTQASTIAADMKADFATVKAAVANIEAKLAAALASTTIPAADLAALQEVHDDLRTFASALAADPNAAPPAASPATSAPVTPAA
jgi:uncharacterized secreted protein with C-terminal beta-propeller domain